MVGKLAKWKQLGNTVAVQLGIDAGIRAVLADMMRETNRELQNIRVVSTAIKKAIQAWIDEGKNTRNEVQHLQVDLKSAKEACRKAQAPFRSNLQELRAVNKRLTREVIPAQLGDLGISIPTIKDVSEIPS